MERVFYYGVSPLERFYVVELMGRTIYLFGEFHHVSHGKNYCKGDNPFIGPEHIISSMMKIMGDKSLVRGDVEVKKSIYGVDGKNMLDIYFEYPYRVKDDSFDALSYFSSEYNSPMLYMMRYYDKCLRKKEKCNYPNVRLHYSDLRPELENIIKKSRVSKQEVINAAIALFYGFYGINPAMNTLNDREKDIMRKLRKEVDQSLVKHQIYDYFNKKMEYYKLQLDGLDNEMFSAHIFALVTDMYTVARFFNPKFDQTNIVSYNGMKHTEILYEFLVYYGARTLVKGENVSDSCLLVNFYESPNLLRVALNMSSKR